MKQKETYKQGLVICKLPKAGLGNQLFPLMKACVFAHLNKLPLTVINYHQLKLGPWLRNDRSKRNYKGFFTFQKGIFGEFLDKWQVRNLLKVKQEFEPEVKVMNRQAEEYESFVFSSVPHYSNYFEGLNEHRDLVIQLLYHMLSPSIKNRLSIIKPAAIAVHIRRGDFRIPDDGEELGSRGVLRTPDSYFINIIHSIRKLNGSNLSVNVFSDASRAQLSEIFKLSNINLIEGNNDLEDLLLLSRSKIIVTSAGSTFSYWAGFLSTAPVILHPTYTGIKIRPQNIKTILYEGAFDDKHEVLIHKVKNIKE